MALHDKAIYDTREKGVGSSRDCGVTLVVDEILGVLCYEHGQVWPRSNGG